MLGRRVPSRCFIDQPEHSLLLLIEFLGIGVSGWLALRFCCDIWPNEPRALCVTAALTWESARLHFTVIVPTTRIQRRGRFALRVLLAILTAGSVGAALFSLDAAHARDQIPIVSAHPLFFAGAMSSALCKNLLILAIAIALKLIAPVARQMRLGGAGAPLLHTATPREKLGNAALKQVANDFRMAPSEYARVETAIQTQNCGPQRARFKSSALRTPWWVFPE